MSVVQPNNTPSSKPVISGIPALIFLAERAAITTPQQLIEIEKRAAEKFAYKLTALLSKNEQWAGLSSLIDITVSGGQISINTNSQRVAELEYGTPDTPMQPMLRTFLKEITEELKDDFDQLLGRLV